MQLKEIAKSIYLVPAENEGRFPYSFSFLLKGKHNILLDAGSGRDNLKKVQDHIGIDLVVISHTHGDHISSLPAIEEIPCVVPETKWDTVTDIDRLGRRFIKGDEKAFTVWKNFMVSTLGVKAFNPSGVYREGDTFSTGNHALVALYAPGHTIDHFCFFEEKTGTFFSFDIDLTPFGPWYGHVESDIESFIRSINTIKEAEPATLASSHIYPVHDAVRALLDGYEEHIYRRDERIEALHAGGLSLEKMVEESPIYGGHPHIPELLIYFETVMIGKHLKRMGLETSP